MGSQQDSPVHSYLESIRLRLDQLDHNAQQIRESAIRMAVFLAIRDEARRDIAIQRCFDAGLCGAPAEGLRDRVEAIISEVVR